jgi:hypothetical protein
MLSLPVMTSRCLGDKELSPSLLGGGLLIPWGNHACTYRDSGFAHHRGICYKSKCN